MRRLQRIAGIILSNLPDRIVEKLAREYNASVYYVKSIESFMVESQIPNPDTAVEWFLSLLNNGFARFDDVVRVSSAARFFFTHNRDPKFTFIVKRDFPDIKNIRNIFGYTLNDVEDVWEISFETPGSPHERERMLKLENLPEGAKLVYNKNGWQLVKVTLSTAACELSRGSKWCTSDAGTASEYLIQDPLYVIYHNGRKMAQMHLGGTEGAFQLKGLGNREIPLTGEIREFLKDAGILAKLAWDRFTQGFIGLYGEVVEGDKELEDQIAEKASHDPKTAFNFAIYVLNDRFPLGELAIARSAILSKEYARSFDFRFHLGEKAIVESGGQVLKSYRWLMDQPEFNQLQGFDHEWGITEPLT